MFDFLFGWRKASKCKRLMRQVQCRLVLLKNRRCSIVRQLRQDVAQLLKLGHAQIALARVEQVYKDERIIEVYDLLDHFCEFVVINLKYIRRHKDCPNDISEAISSLIFASARCGDIPELRRARKLFADRYGQNFVMSALQLLPGNLVNSQIRNNLSIKTVAEDARIRLVNEVFRNNRILHDIYESPLALEYNSKWHQQEMKGKRVDETLDVAEATENLRAKDDEVLCITLPVSSPADQPSSPINALVPVTEGPEKQENRAQVGIPDDSKNLVLASLSPTSDEFVQCQEENVVYLVDIHEFQSPKSRDINLIDRRVFIFKFLVLPKKQKIEDDLPLPAAGSFKKTSKVCNRQARKRLLSREYWNFKDLSYEHYYGNRSSGILSNNTCKSIPRRKQLKNSLDNSRTKMSPCRSGSVTGEKTLTMGISTNSPKQGIMIPSSEPSQSRSESSREVISENGMEETKESDFYSCSDCSSGRPISMLNERQDMEQHAHFARHSSFQVQLLKNGNQIRHGMPDYEELESTFLALKNAYLLNKNC